MLITMNKIEQFNIMENDIVKRKNDIVKGKI